MRLGWSNGATRGDGMQLVRADLVTRLDRLETALSARGPLVGRDDVAGIVAIAAEHDLTCVRRLAEGLGVALARGGRGAAIGPWIERLRDALACDARDEQSADTWLAAVMVRLAF
ncbi:MAG TPA: hypothetical protein VGC10_07300 [Sphingomonas sp.]